MDSDAPISIRDYLIDHAGIDWSATLTPWSWLVPSEFTVWLVTRIADMFLVMPDGTVHMLDVGNGSLEKVAESREDFAVKIDQDENANNWLAIPLVDRLVAAGIKLHEGECYGFKKAPLLGGEYSIENIAPMAIVDYLGAYGSIHQQLQEVPDGTQVVLKVV